MFFVLSKFFSFALDPVAHFIVLAGLAGLACRRRTQLTFFSVILLAYLILIAASPIPGLLAYGLESSYPPVVSPPHKDAALVLSGGTLRYAPDVKQFQWETSADRIMEAVRLFKSGIVDRLVLVGGEPATDSNLLDETLSMKKIAVEMGVPESKIAVEDKSLNTRQNGQFVAKILDENKIRDFYLVTSAMHMRRSVAVFQKQGLAPSPYPVDFQITETGFKRFFIWGTAALEIYKAALHEIVGFWVYRLAGFV